jgi:hypothetical protein
MAALYESGEREAQVAVAVRIESGGVCVAIKSAPFYSVPVGNLPGIEPFHEFGLDLIALRMLADRTMPFVVIGRKFVGGIRCPTAIGSALIGSAAIGGAAAVARILAPLLALSLASSLAPAAT